MVTSTVDIVVISEIRVVLFAAVTLLVLGIVDALIFSSEKIQATSSGEVHCRPDVEIFPMQHLAAPPDLDAQPEPPHLPQLAAQQILDSRRSTRSPFSHMRGAVVKDA